MKIVTGIFFCLIVAFGCNKKAAPAASNTENNAAEPQTEQPPAMKTESIPAIQNMQIKKIDINKLKMYQTNDTTAPANTNPNVVQPRPVGAPVEAAPKQP